MEPPGNNRERPSPPNSPLNSPWHPTLLSIPEAFAMGVCSSTEPPFEQGVTKPENGFNPDPLKKEHLEDEVMEKPDSSIAAISDG